MGEKFKYKTKFEIVNLIIKSAIIQKIFKDNAKISLRQYNAFLIIEEDYMRSFINKDQFSKLLKITLKNC